MCSTFGCLLLLAFFVPSTAERYSVEVKGRLICGHDVNILPYVPPAELLLTRGAGCVAKTVGNATADNSVQFGGNFKIVGTYDPAHFPNWKLRLSISHRCPDAQPHQKFIPDLAAKYPTGQEGNSLYYDLGDLDLKVPNEPLPNVPC